MLSKLTESLNFVLVQLAPFESYFLFYNDLFLKIN